MIPENNNSSLFAGFVGIGIVCILGFVTWALIYREVPQENQNNLTILLGVLSANVGMVVGYYFGSSATTKKLAETNATLAKTAQTAGAALGTPDGALLIPTGDSATATATDAGTIIEKEAE